MRFAVKICAAMFAIVIINVALCKAACSDINSNKINEARSLLDKATTKANEVDSKIEKVILLIDICNSYINIKEYNIAKNILKEILTVAMAIEDKGYRDFILSDLVKLFTDLKMIEDAETLFTEIRFESEEARIKAINYIISFYVKNDNLKRAEQILSTYSNTSENFRLRMHSAIVLALVEIGKINKAMFVADNKNDMLDLIVTTLIANNKFDEVRRILVEKYFIDRDRYLCQIIIA